MKLLFTSLFTTTTLFAQNKLYDHNTIAWNQLQSTITTGKKTSAHLEYNWRRIDGFKNWQQSLTRLGVNYNIDKNLSLHIGYGYAYNFVFGDYPARGNVKENRIYQQLTHKTNYNKLTITQRLRIEQRWVSALTATGAFEKWVYSNRFRLMEKIQAPLPKDYFFAFTDEIFINAGKNVGVNIFDQNRILISGGKKISKALTIELGYFNLVQQQGKLVNNKIVVQRNNGLLLSVITNF